MKLIVCKHYKYRTSNILIGFFKVCKVFGLELLLRCRVKDQKSADYDNDFPVRELLARVKFKLFLNNNLYYKSS